MDERIAKATAGDEDALAEILFESHDRLLMSISRKIPTDLQSLVDAEDVLQQTYVQAFRDIGSFKPKSEQSFYRWLETIAEHRLVDTLRALRRKKRGGGRQKVDNRAACQTSSVADLLDVISDGLTSPSGKVAREEGVRELQVQLARLPDDYREAIRLRHLEGLDLDDVALEMDRPVDAVRGLLYRGKKKLRAAMGKSSLWLSKKQ